MKRQPTSQDEIDRLFQLVDRDLEQARVPGLYPDGQFTFVYNAALQLCTILIRSHGVRVGTVGRHQETFHEAAGLVPKEVRPLIQHFDRARRKRNTLLYDRAGTVTEREVEDLFEAVGEFREWVRTAVSGSP
jgi:hypothetical protein